MFSKAEGILFSYRLYDLITLVFIIQKIPPFLAVVKLISVSKFWKYRLLDFTLFFSFTLSFIQAGGLLSCCPVGCYWHCFQSFQSLNICSIIVYKWSSFTMHTCCSSVKSLKKGSNIIVSNRTFWTSLVQLCFIIVTVFDSSWNVYDILI